mgnify:CR=1 FL=1
MFRTIRFTTASTISAGDDVDLPAAAPDIDEVISASIYRVGSAISDHTLDTQVAVGGAVTNALGHDATPELETAAGGNVNIAGCISAHDSENDPEVAVTATKSDADTVTLDVDFEAGDQLILNYVPVGARLQVT